MTQENTQWSGRQPQQNPFDNQLCFPAFLAITVLVPVNLFIMNTTDAVKAADNGFLSIVETLFVIFFYEFYAETRICCRNKYLVSDSRLISLWICGELTALGRLQWLKHETEEWEPPSSSALLGSVGGFLCRMLGWSGLFPVLVVTIKTSFSQSTDLSLVFLFFLFLFLLNTIN